MEWYHFIALLIDYDNFCSIHLIMFEYKVVATVHFSPHFKSKEKWLIKSRTAKPHLHSLHSNDFGVGLLERRLCKFWFCCFGFPVPVIVLVRVNSLEKLYCEVVQLVVICYLGWEKLGKASIIRGEAHFHKYIN